MAKWKIIVAKVFVGIICAILMLGTLFMSIVLVAVSNPHSDHNGYELDPTYENLPNVMGDDGVYVAKNFFIENNFTVSEYASFGQVRYKESNYVSFGVGKGHYDGRVDELAYHFTSKSLDKDENVTKYITVYCDPKNIAKLQNKREYNGYTYGERKAEKTSPFDGIITTDYYYTVNFKRNENTSKKCQVTMIVTVKRSKEMPSADYKESCDKLFYSLLDNIVYRNI